VPSLNNLVHAKHISLAQRMKQGVGNLSSSSGDDNSQRNLFILQSRKAIFLYNTALFQLTKMQNETRMWANAQGDGRPAD